MFRRGGPANDGIMSGIVDREEKQIGDVAGRAREITPELEALLREFTPKTRLPLGSNCNCKPMNGANSPKPLFGLQTANRHFR